MEDLFLTKIWEAIKIFADSIDWFFVLIFMVITWLTLEGVSALFTKWKLNKAAITIFVLILGFLLASLYSVVYEINDKVGMAELFYSVIAGMVIYKIGVDKLFELIKNKLKKS